MPGSAIGRRVRRCDRYAVIRHTTLADTTATDWFVQQVASVLSEDAGSGRRPVLAERRAAGGQMPPLHTRDEGEAYRVTRGIVTFFVGDETISAGPGDVVVAPAGVERSFRVESDRATWVVLTHVRSLPRFEDWARAVSTPLETWPSVEEAAAVAAIGRANGIELLGPPGALPR
jgi:mannose-6-phosphate isomerase-like protein (cupin superfamily)